MEPPIHTLSELFSQLGLPKAAEEVEHFIEKHRPLAKEIPLHEASFWNGSQKEFLKQQIALDADWAELIDQLNSRLR
ncbi:hypothetical protein GCM10007891_03510 [Methylophaga thalassica]|uniref:DUF2789 domain-containing protein n=1 Tax=Methylophaga thalassica TaxID=40223 RepID=A0ABQ5TSF0_9GAMM|nr:DUF2789 domain-containing protein [Methylophaga thalassica]GLP98497.1 hypothetical protein GCM10007891_03510 [Methylophaga thalassica]